MTKRPKALFWLIFVPTTILLLDPIRTSMAAEVSQCSIVLYDNIVSCVTAPDVQISIEIASAAGEQRGAGTGWSDRRTGQFSIPLGSEDGLARTVIQPGDELRIATDDSVGVTLHIPELYVNVSTDGTILVGQGEKDSALSFMRGRITLDSAELSPIAVAPDGRFEVPLNPALMPGDVGFVRQQQPGLGDVYAIVAAPTFRLLMNPPRLVGTVSPGTSMTLNMDHAGIARSSGLTVTNESTGTPGAFVLLLGELDAGTRVDLMVHGPGSEVIELPLGSLPSLWVAVDRAQSMIYGIAPPGQRVRVRAGPLSVLRRGVAPIDQTVEAATDGAFTVDGSAASAPIGGGWFADVSYELNQPVEIAARYVLPIVRAEVYGSSISGNVDPESPITVTLRGAGGERKAQMRSKTGVDGAFSTQLVGLGLARAAEIEPQDVIVIDSGTGGDPMEIRVPKVSAITDREHGQINGRAEPGALIEVFITGAKAPLMQARVGVDGVYQVAAPGITWGSSGVVRITMSNDRVFDIRWAVLHIEVDLDLPVMTISGTGLPGRAVTVDVIGSDGRRVTDLREDLAALGRGDIKWLLPILDKAGLATRLQPGDTVDVSVGDEARRFTIPTFDLRPDMASNTVAGRARPHSVVNLAVHRPDLGMQPIFSEDIIVTADANGEFFAALPDAFRLGHNDRILGTTEADDGVSLRRSTVIPGVIVNLTTSTLRGGLDHEGEYTIQLLRQGHNVVLGDDTFSVDSEGRFMFEVRNANNAPETLSRGDIVRISDQDKGDEALVVTIPSVSAIVDWATGSVTGLAPLDHDVWIVASPAQFRGFDVEHAQGSLHPSRSSGGGFAGQLVDFEDGLGARTGIEARPGVRLEVRSQQPDGMQFVHEMAVPIVSAAVGGGAICALGDPGAEVALSLRAVDGTIISELASGHLGSNGRYSTGWLDSRGTSKIAHAGDRVVGHIGDSEIDFALGALTLSPIWDAGIPAGRALDASRVVGTAKPGSKYFVSLADSQDDECFAGLDSNHFYTYGRTDTAGRFSAATESVDVGMGVEVAQYAASGHRYYRRMNRLMVRAQIGSRQIELRAAPDIAVEIEWTRDTTVIGRFQGMTDGFGMLAATLAAPQAGVSVLLAGDQVAITSAGEHTALVVEPLDIDDQGPVGLLGTAPSGRAVRVDITLRDGRTLRFNIPADERGRFSLTPADLPSRRDWQLVDVKAIEAAITVIQGHEVFLRLGDKTVLPDERKLRVWLPIMLRRWSGSPR